MSTVHQAARGGGHGPQPSDHLRFAFLAALSRAMAVRRWAGVAFAHRAVAATDAERDLSSGVEHANRMPALRRPAFASPGYGVEIASGAAAERLQVRAVNFGGSDAARDRDMETIWCGEFERLRQIVAKSGGEVTIEKATPAGATPLKTVEGYEGYLAAVERAAPKRSLQAR